MSFLKEDISPRILSKINKDFDENEEFIINFIKNNFKEFCTNNKYFSIKDYNNIKYLRYMEDNKVAFGTLIFQYVELPIYCYFEMIKNVYNENSNFCLGINEVSQYNPSRPKWYIEILLPIIKNIRYKYDKKYNNFIYTQNIERILIIANKYKYE